VLKGVSSKRPVSASFLCHVQLFPTQPTPLRSVLCAVDYYRIVILGSRQPQHPNRVSRARCHGDFPSVFHMGLQGASRSPLEIFSRTY
jgi:hypothetical protein